MLPPTPSLPTRGRGRLKWVNIVRMASGRGRGEARPTGGVGRRRGGLDGPTRAGARNGPSYGVSSFSGVRP